MPRPRIDLALALLPALSACSLLFHHEGTTTERDGPADVVQREAGAPLDRAPPDRAPLDLTPPDEGPGDSTEPGDIATDSSLSGDQGNDGIPKLDAFSDTLLADAVVTSVITNPVGAVICPTGQPCEVRCTAASSCSGLISCGPDPCKIWCSGLYSCAGGIQCGPSSSCTVYCEPTTCQGKITCGPGRCLIDCAADNACGDVDCTTSCGCDLYCREGECSPSYCPTSCSNLFGCVSSPPGCDTC